MQRPCPHCDHPDSSLLRIVLIGEMIRAGDATLYAIAEVLQSLGILELSDEDASEVAMTGLGKRGLRLVK